MKNSLKSIFAVIGVLSVVFILYLFLRPEEKKFTGVVKKSVCLGYDKWSCFDADVTYQDDLPVYYQSKGSVVGFRLFCSDLNHCFNENDFPIVVN